MVCRKLIYIKKEESVPFPDGEIMLSSFLEMDKRIHLF